MKARDLGWGRTLLRHGGNRHTPTSATLFDYGVEPERIGAAIARSKRLPLGVSLRAVEKHRTDVLSLDRRASHSTE
jgi:hypothetical protein